MCGNGLHRGQKHVGVAGLPRHQNTTSATMSALLSRYMLLYYYKEASPSAHEVCAVQIITKGKVLLQTQGDSRELVASKSIKVQIGLQTMLTSIMSCNWI